MAVGAKFTNAENCGLINVEFRGFDIAAELIDSSSISLQEFRSDPGITSQDHLKRYRKFAGRNQLCPCGSGVKTKKCKGTSRMTTGIRSDNSSFTVGKATIVADVGVDLKNGSVAHIDELNYIAPNIPDLDKVLASLPVPPSPFLVQDAIAQHKATGTIEGSKLKAWFDAQGINLAFWAQLTGAITALA